MHSAARYFLSFCGILATATGAVVYDEAIDGDFSDDYLNPNPVVLGAGDNFISGVLQGASLDMDLFTLTVPNALQLTAIRVISLTGGVNGSFMGAHVGPVMTTSPFDYIRAGMGAPVRVDPINYVLFGELDAAVQRDVMPQLVVGAPMSGQSPLPAGEYAFWLNETRVRSIYTLNFEVTPVSIPEPTAVLLCVAGLACHLGRRVRGR